MNTLLDFIFMYHLLSSTTYSKILDDLMSAITCYDAVGRHCADEARELRSVILGFSAAEPMPCLRKVLWENLKLAFPDTRIAVTGSYTPREWPDAGRYNWLMKLDAGDLQSFLEDQCYIDYRKVLFGPARYRDMKLTGLRYKGTNWGWFDLTHKIADQSDIKDAYIARIREVFGITQDLTSPQLGNDPAPVSRSSWITEQLAKQNA